MAKITITEALAEIKTIGARIQKKRESVMRYFSRDARLLDPMKDEGGSTEFVRRERQAIEDLEERVVKIRTAIQIANLSNRLQIGSQVRTVQAWLNWRREVANSAKGFLQQLANQLNAVRQNAQRQGQQVVAGESYSPGDVIVSVNERELAAEIESTEEILGQLDGKLSLFNATVPVEV